MTSGQTLVWSSPRLTYSSSGTCEKYDPGTGPERYRRALEAIRRSGMERGFVSFTFDPGASGSIVVLPADGDQGRMSPTGSSLPPGRVVDDGVEQWSAGFDKAAAMLERGEIDKVVLARRVDVVFDEEAEPGEVVGRLDKPAQESYLFAIDGLVGASPELLVELSEGRLSSFPLAGTAPSADGLADPTIQREHQLTAESAQRSLAPYLAGSPSPVREVVDLGGIKHLGTRIAGAAREGATVADVLEDLHPTPAIGGVPAARAMELIRELEPRGRGRYGGPIGWMNADGEGEIALAIRCGMFRGSKAELYAGGGLVVGCQREAELRETELKLVPMFSALGVEP